MKRSVFAIALVVVALAATVLAQAPAGRPSIFAPPVTPSGPIVEVVNAIVTAFNKQDTAYFQKMIAPDTVWFDEDGHHLAAMVWMNRVMMANPARKLSITNLRVGNWDTAGWAGFSYVVEGTNLVKGTNTLFFKKTGNDWQIVLIHGAVDTAIVPH